MLKGETLEFMLREVCKVHTNKVNKVLSEFGLHKGQPLMLRTLYHKDGVPQSYLAKKLAIKPATASAMVKRLEKSGYVIRNRDATDERISNVYLTDSGRELSVKLRSYQTQMNSMICEGLSENEKQLMKEILLKIFKNLSD